MWRGGGDHHGQTEAMKQVAPKAQNMTCRRTKFKNYVDEVATRKNTTKSRVRAKVEQVSYPKVMIEAGIHGRKHETINRSAGVYVDGDVTTNGIESAFSLLKRGIIGSWN